MTIHESVTYCRKCDHYVAEIETQPCDECGSTICPGCAKPTKDPDLNACSHVCAAAINKRMKEVA